MAVYTCERVLLRNSRGMQYPIPHILPGRIISYFTSEFLSKQQLEQRPKQTGINPGFWGRTYPPWVRFRLWFSSKGGVGACPETWIDPKPAHGRVLPSNALRSTRSSSGSSSSRLDKRSLLLLRRGDLSGLASLGEGGDLICGSTGDFCGLVKTNVKASAPSHGQHDERND